CARIKMHVNRMTREEIDGIVVQPIGGSVVVMKQIVAAEGNGLIIELTAKQPTRFYLHHDKYGDSNEVSLNLEGDKEYRLSAELNIAYPIFVKSNVAEAEVYIDNEYKGHTNDRYTLIVKDIQPGRHTLKIKYGTEVKEQDIEVTSNNLDFDIGLSTKASLPQIIEFSVEPANATVYINDTPYSAQRDGTVIIALNKGTYDYRVSADMYHDERGSLTITDSKVSKSITLKPAYGWIEIGATSLLSGAHIYIDNVYAGTAPLKSGDLASGKHTLRVVKDMYRPYEEVIIITDNKTLTFNTAPLIADYATVTFDAGSGCDIYINNERKGASPWTGKVVSGTYIIEARREGHRTTTLSQSITSTPSKQTYKLDAPTPILGTINVTSTPVLADIYIDGKLVGKTPLMYNVVVGKHDVMIKAKGYRTNKQSVTVAEGKTINLNISLQKGSDNTEKNVIEYVMPNKKMEISDAYSKFGANIKSHTWDSATGKGVITFKSNVTKIGYQAFYLCSSLTSVTIPDSVTEIGNYAFYGCGSLTSITIPDSVTTIGYNAFDGCKSLTSITIPDSVTTIGERAFDGCKSLTSVTIPDSVTKLGRGAFGHCSILKSVTIGDCVTIINEHTFSGCEKLTEVTIGKGVQTIQEMAFYGCKHLTHLTLNCEITAYNLNEFAEHCNIRDVTIGDDVTEIGDKAFDDWHFNINNITIGKSVVSIGYRAFSGCDITSISIPDSVTTIGDYAFYWCSSLASIIIPDSVTTIGDYALAWCKSLTSVTIPDSVTSIGYAAFEDCSSLTSVTIPDSVTTIGNYAFEDCNSLTSVTIPDNVTTIGRYAFSGCWRLASVTIGDSVTKIGEKAFYDCSSLKSIYCKATTPPSLGVDVFKKSAFSRKIYVPMQSVKQYKSAKGWKRIKGYNF
ncbi:MAG: leucine-rich repeat protein, partial [Alistipes sp.]|nr:leucine-rich repeat protein [Alistipes sp.]